MAFFNIAFLWVHPSRYSESIPYLPNEELEQPSTYIGLDTVIRGFPSPPVTITNFPFLLAQVDSSKPEHIVLDTHHWLSGMGMVYPDDRRFQVSSEVSLVGLFRFCYSTHRLPMQISTIAQFRVMDHGMEFCRLKMVVPSLLILENASRKKTVNMSDDTIEIEVWRLNAHGRLLPSRLSWSSRPERTTLQASWRVQMGETVGTAQFPCSSGSLQTFELACGRLPCNILFQQDNKEPRLGMCLDALITSPSVTHTTHSYVYGAGSIFPNLNGIAVHIARKFIVNPCFRQTKKSDMLPFYI